MEIQDDGLHAEISRFSSCRQGKSENPTNLLRLFGTSKSATLLHLSTITCDVNGEGKFIIVAVSPEIIVRRLLDQTAATSQQLNVVFR
jgi:hypothetical protein